MKKSNENSKLKIHYLKCKVHYKDVTAIRHYRRKDLWTLKQSKQSTEKIYCSTEYKKREKRIKKKSLH